MNFVANLLVSATLAILSHNVASADAFDDKARAVAAERAEVAQHQAYEARVHQINSDNTSIVRRVPRGASITKCYDINAFRYRRYPNGCYLADGSWNGYPVQYCSDVYRSEQNLPLEIIECHYHVASTGRDCRIVRNPSIQPECY